MDSIVRVCVFCNEYQIQSVCVCVCGNFLIFKEYTHAHAQTPWASLARSTIRHHVNMSHALQIHTDKDANTLTCHILFSQPQLYVCMCACVFAYTQCVLCILMVSIAVFVPNILSKIKIWKTFKDEDS